jgi:uncharacterized repeat protein (TIGR03803 family)
LFYWLAEKGQKGVVKTFLILAASVLLVVLACPGRVSGLTMTTLHGFGGGDGRYPLAGLVQGTDGWFYGTATYGGTNNNAGTVFRAGALGGFTVLHDFDGTTAGNPHAGLVQGADGNFYGTTLQPSDNGTVFRISPQGVYTNLYSFGGAPDGSAPWAGLVLGSDSNFYGTTEYGGRYTNTIPDGCGTVYRITPAGVLTNLYQFSGGTDGNLVYGGLVEGSPGNFYGTTLLGGASGEGVVFRITSTGAFTNLYSFPGGTNGALPSAGLVHATDGNFYGTTTGGGIYGSGTVYRISAAGAFTNLYSFGSGTDGAFPYDALIQGSDSNFYGATQLGGTHGQGTLFKITPPRRLDQLVGIHRRRGRRRQQGLRFLRGRGAGQRR